MFAPGFEQALVTQVNAMLAASFKAGWKGGASTSAAEMQNQTSYQDESSDEAGQIGSGTQVFGSPPHLLLKRSTQLFGRHQRIHFVLGRVF